MNTVVVEEEAAVAEANMEAVVDMIMHPALGKQEVITVTAVVGEALAMAGHLDITTIRIIFFLLTSSENS